MLNQLRIARLKLIAKWHYIAHEKIYGEADCGASMIEDVCAQRLAYHAGHFNIAMDRLQELGAPIPEFRFPYPGA